MKFCVRISKSFQNNIKLDFNYLRNKIQFQISGKHDRLDYRHHDWIYIYIQIKLFQYVAIKSCY